jgi:hypothetical protein
MMRLAAFALLSGLAALPAAAAPEIALQNGQTVNFTLPGSSFSTSYYIDVPASSQEFRLQLNNTSPLARTNLYLRYATPFADRTANENAAPDENLFSEYAQYRSALTLGDESLRVYKSSTVPLRAGRWFVAVTNAGTTEQPVALTATLRDTAEQSQIDFNFAQSLICDTAPWNDATPVQPIDGNPGTTLGEQRRNAIRYAGQRLFQELRSPMPVRVLACWEALGGDMENGAPVAQAGPTTIFAGDVGGRAAWLPEPYTWYAAAEVTRLSGTSTCATANGACDSNDIQAYFNSDLDPPRNVIGMPFYYGYTGASKPENSIDFIAVAMHELTHGLGFFGLTMMDPLRGPIGSRYPRNNLGYDDIFGRNIVTVDTANRTYKPFYGSDTSDAERAAALVSGDGLRWSGAEAAASERNLLRNQAMPDNFPRLFAPCEREAPENPCGVRRGSTLSHTTQPGDLMNPFYSDEILRELGLALPMLNAMGWSNAPAPAAAFATPIAGNWYDRARSGHGIDFQLYSRDAVNGDLYFVIFYTFESDRQPEYYLGLGRLIDGRFIGAKQGDGIALMRLRYNAQLGRSELDRSSRGTLLIDFNKAGQSPYCRSASRSGAGALAVMNWSIRDERGTWCLEPAVLPASHTAPDFSGHWYSGNSSDQGWGMELLSIKGVAGQSQLVVVFYYPDLQGRSRWVISGLADVNLSDTQDLPLYEVHGYCRTCLAPEGPNPVTAVGSIRLRLTSPTRTEPADGANRVSVRVQIPNVADFRRDDVPLTLLSAPPGE